MLGRVVLPPLFHQICAHRGEGERLEQGERARAVDDRYSLQAAF